MLSQETLNDLDYLAGIFLRDADHHRDAGNHTVALLFDKLADATLATLDADGVLWRALQSVEATG